MRSLQLKRKRIERHRTRVCRVRAVDPLLPTLLISNANTEPDFIPGSPGSASGIYSSSGRLLSEDSPANRTTAPASLRTDRLTLTESSGRDCRRHRRGYSEPASDT